MALTFGNVTIKKSGGTYSSWAAFWNDLGNLTGNITCTIDAESFSETGSPSAITENFGGFTITVQAASLPTTTDGTTGARFSVESTATGWLYVNNADSGTIKLKGIVGLPGATKTVTTWVNCSGAQNTGMVFWVENCLFRGGTTASIWSNGSYSFELHVLNCIIDRPIKGIRWKTTNTSVIANNTIIIESNTGTNYGIYVNAGNYFNNLVHNTDEVAFYNFSTSNVGYNNSSYDATADDFVTQSGGRVNKTVDPFVNSATLDYRLSAGSDPIGNGYNASAYLTTDFFGNTRTTWDIGAVLYSTPAGLLHVKSFDGITFSHLKNVNGVAQAHIKNINGIN